MRFVQQAAIRPHRCAVLPTVNNSTTRRGFVDTGQELRERDQVYVSIEAVEALAKLIGWGPPDVASRAKVQQLERRVAQLEDEVAEADRFAEAAEYTLERFGSKVRAKPGRKKTAA